MMSVLGFGEDMCCVFTLINCDVCWGFLITVICRQRRSLLVKVEERKHLVCVRAQPDLGAAEVSEEMLIGYFRLLTKLGPVASEHRAAPLPAGTALLRLMFLSWKSCCCGPRRAARRWIRVVHEVLPREEPWLALLSMGLCPPSWAGQGFSTGPPSPGRQSFTPGAFYLLRWACEIMVRETVLAWEYAG